MRIEQTKGVTTMQPGRLKPILIKAHRWIGLTLAPLFLLITLSGAVLALKPILQPQAPITAKTDVSPLDTARLISLLQGIDPTGNAIQGLTIDASLGQFNLSARDEALRGSYALSTGTKIDTAQQAVSPDFFKTVERLHKALLIGVDFPTELASYLMLAIVVVAPFLAWPRLRNNLMGWHRAIGWSLLPLLAMLPLTGVLMSLHVGAPELPRMSQPGLSLPIAEALRIAARDQDLTQLTLARRFHGGSVLIGFDDGAGEQMLAVTDRTVTPLDADGNLVKQLHEGNWSGPLSGSLNLLGAIALSLLTLTGVYAWVRRHRHSKLDKAADSAEILIAYASQTGTAARLAQSSLEVLKSAGARVALVSLNALLPQQILDYRQSLLLVSTTGEGDLPDAAQAFLRHLSESHLLGGRFSMLALGDRRYRHFCGGAERLRDALISAGAVESLPMQRIDGKPEQAWQRWLDKIAEGLKITVEHEADLSAAGWFKVTLRDRQRLDKPHDDGMSHPSYRLLLQTESEHQFQAGDLLQIAPDGDERLRSYSIGSSAELTPGLIRLTVSLHRWVDARGETHTGTASGMLCEKLQPGDGFNARLNPHPDFHAPEDINRPLILIASGCGIAPFMGFIEQREYSVSAGPVWLIYGNRWQAVDYLYREQLESQQNLGVITRLDTVFSRDQETPRYVTHRMREEGETLVRWLLEEDAALYVCGRGSTLGQGVDQALREILERHMPHDSDSIAALIASWSANGKLRRDLFD
jgi:sulfite reductase (NADPH) flavoprotein alpha-component